MFRDTKISTIDPTNFGAGSIVKDGRDGYLVVAYGRSVGLVSLGTFQIYGQQVAVLDPNFLSSDEARDLCANIIGAAFSDLELLTVGIKGYNHRK